MGEQRAKVKTSKFKSQNLATKPSSALLCPLVSLVF